MVANNGSMVIHTWKNAANVSASLAQPNFDLTKVETAEMEFRKDLYLLKARDLECFNFDWRQYFPSSGAVGFQRRTRWYQNLHQLQVTASNIRKGRPDKCQKSSPTVRCLRCQCFLNCFETVWIRLYLFTVWWGQRVISDVRQEWLCCDALPILLRLQFWKSSESEP